MFFNETHSDGEVALTFIKSANIQAYPCGRRRSTAIDQDGDLNTTTDKQYIPFDPEARLNTEANNRKHSSLNGYTQTYLKNWDDSEKLLTISLAGYLFTISLKDGEGNYIDKTIFGNNVNENAEYIYANILLEDVHLFSGFEEYYTSILRNQSATDFPETSLDLPNTDTVNKKENLKDLQNFENYYFSGLSFSAAPLTGKEETRSSDSREFTKAEYPGRNFKQLAVSLRLLEKIEGTWQVHEPARLPNIEHGDKANSVKVANFVAADIETNTFTTASANIKNGLTATTISATTIGDKTKTNISAKKADITEAIIGTATIEALTVNDTIASPHLEQVVGENRHQVPIIELVADSANNEYQLQISRVGKWTT